VGIALGPSEHEKLCVDVSCVGCTEMYYVTQRSLRMQKHQFTHQTRQNALRDPKITPDPKHKFGLTGSGVPFVESISVPPEHEK
jgi:hypothetical protein